MRYTACYDVADDRRRADLVKILEDYGHRVQRSVFEFDLDANTLDALLDRVRPVLDADVDSVIIYRLCGDCRGAVRVLGPDPRPRRRRAIIV